MASANKNQSAILSKLGIESLNPMQEKTHDAITNHPNTVLLSPTGTGKTLAFLLPILPMLNPTLEAIQALILVPSRELAIQIEQVVREMGSGFKTNAVYGGRAGSKDKIELKHPPAILIGTPGRISDHINTESIDVTHVKILVLDEFDKSLEVGFTEQMEQIVRGLPNLKKKILTSATQKVKVPKFMGVLDPKHLNFLKKTSRDLHVKLVESKTEDKLDSITKLLGQIGEGNGIVFCNLKDSIHKVSSALKDVRIDHACFYGGLEQIDRERALLKFRNGTHRILLATDLAARGIDVPELNFIVHFELPPRPDEYIHRNGRTARMHSEGTAYVVKWVKEELPVFVKVDEVLHLKSTSHRLKKEWVTLHISGGRKDKISKGDIAGLFMKQGGLVSDKLGVIELKQDHAYVSVPYSMADVLIKKLNNSRLKKKKVRISLLK